MNKVVSVESSVFLSGITEIPMVKIGNYEFTFEAELSEQARKVAERELKETPERKKEAIAKLKYLLDKEEDLTYPDNEFWFIKFLRKCKFYPESACEMIKKYYNIKVKYPEKFHGFKANNYLDIANTKMFMVMPRRDHKGRRIFVACIRKDFVINAHSIDEIIKGINALMELATMEPDTQVNGVVLIIDFGELTLNHVKPLTPSVIRFIVMFLRDRIPLRLKAFHILNESSIVDAVYVIFKNFLSEKLRNRFYFHGNDYQSLHEYIAPNCLPVSYGGTLYKDLDEVPRVEELLDQYADFVDKYEKELEVINSYGYNKDKAESTDL